MGLLLDTTSEEEIEFYVMLISALGINGGKG